MGGWNRVGMMGVMILEGAEDRREDVCWMEEAKSKVGEGAG